MTMLFFSSSTNIYIYIYIYIIIVVIFFFFFLFQMTGWAGIGGGVIHSLSGSRSPSTPADLLLPLLVSLSRSLSSGEPSFCVFFFVRWFLSPLVAVSSCFLSLLPFFFFFSSSSSVCSLPPSCCPFPGFVCSLFFFLSFFFNNNNNIKRCHL